MQKALNKLRVSNKIHNDKQNCWIRINIVDSYYREHSKSQAVKKILVFKNGVLK